MAEPLDLVIILILLVGPIASRPIERNIEIYFFILGVGSTALGGGFDRRLVERAVLEPIPITIAVIVAGVVFALLRGGLDRMFERMRAAMRREVLVALAVFVVALLSSLITAIIAALALVEVVGMLRLAPHSRIRVTVAGCFAIGICSSLTPLGGPLSTLAAGALRLGFWGLFDLVGGWALPGTFACAALAGFLARDGDDLPPGAAFHVRERTRDAIFQGIRVFGFVAGLILIGEAFEPVATRYVNLLSDSALFWGNSVSAVLDNSTLVALEISRMEPVRARVAILALLISGGMLIPGNIPNIIAAGALRIGSLEWAKVGLPLGLVLMAVYFVALRLLG
ncbi:MAG: DUF1646 family protein [Candidatus Binataceae bacterium]